MKKTIFFNIGNREILIRNEPMDKNTLRAQSERILENYELEKQHIQLQIIKPLIEKFQDEIQEIVLIVTDQGKNVYSHQDTLFLGEIIKRKLIDLYCIKNVVIKKYEGNPIEFEEIFPYMTRLVKQYDNDGTLKVICNSGGTPQMKQSLLLLATNLLLPREVESYQIDEKTGAVVPIALSNTFRAEFVKRSCWELVQNYEYSAALNLVLDNNFQSKSVAILLALLNYGKNRLTFAFEDANHALDSSQPYVSSIEWDKLEQFKIPIRNKQRNKNEIQQFRIENILELYNNLSIQWQKENYVDFLTRLFCLEEEIYYYFIEKQFNVNLNSKNERKKFIEDIKNDQKISEKLEKRSYRGSPMEFRTESKPFLFNLLDIDEKNRWVTRELNKIGNYLDESNESLKKTVNKNIRDQEGLDHMRNKSIAAHGFEPVSRQRIEKAYGEPIENLLNKLKKIISGIKREIKEQIKIIPTFEDLNKLIHFMLFNK